LLAGTGTPTAVGLLLAACRLASSTAQAAMNASAVTWVLYLKPAQQTQQLRVTLHASMLLCVNGYDSLQLASLVASLPCPVWAGYGMADWCEPTSKEQIS
jgi:hypothetical protein